MDIRTIGPGPVKWSGLLAVFLSFAIAASPLCRAYAESNADRRVKFGMMLFRSMLAADLDIMDKKNPDGNFIILIVYGASRGAAEKSVEIVERMGEKKELTIKDIPLEFRMIPVGELNGQSGAVAGIFLSERLMEKDFASFVDFGVERKLIAYSPFEGDVEAGAMGGLSVEAKVRPYINVKTMNRSGVRIKPFFMKVTKTYE